VAFAITAFTVGCVVWLRIHIVPPGCEDPATLALVRQSLTGHFKLPASTKLEFIQTMAGGFVAFRFVCEAQLADINPAALSPNSPIPGTVHYISQLTSDHRRHEVKVSVQPLLIWEQVQ
jgi:hypothetical protein